VNHHPFALAKFFSKLLELVVSRLVRHPIRLVAFLCAPARQPSRIAG